MIRFKNRRQTDFDTLNELIHELATRYGTDTMRGFLGTWIRDDLRIMDTANLKYKMQMEAKCSGITKGK